MPEEYLGTDIGFSDDGDLILQPIGDMTTVTGRDCLITDLKNRLLTPRGDLWHHPEYGFDVYRFVHQENTDINRLELEQAIQTEVEQDPRVISCAARVVQWDSTDIKVQIAIIPVGEGNQINLVFDHNLQTIESKVL